MFENQKIKSWVWFIFLWICSLGCTVLFAYSIKWTLRVIG
jgi:hypothetical protein